VSQPEVSQAAVRQAELNQAAAAVPDDSAGIAAALHAAVIRRGRRLAYLSVASTVVEAGVALYAGIEAGSTALLGFGVDSLIEVFSAAVVLWRLLPGEHGQRRERMATRLAGASLLALAVYVTVAAAITLVQRHSLELRPQPSKLGLGMALVSIVVMQWLARGKRRVAAELESTAVQADAVQSQICSYLAAILLVGLGLNALFGWWWADPLAALAMVPLIVTEGLEAWRGNACACHHHSDRF
jgi:divalent metal cation (Fe/Co/Zn/Cd) transporter